MIHRNPRHLRLFLAVIETGSLTEAARRGRVTQPAVTQAIAKIEKAAGGPLFDRTGRGLFPTVRGNILARRVRRAFQMLDPALAAVSLRLLLTATGAQLTALTALCVTENYTLAARRLGLAQPTVHRAVTQLEREAGRALFEKTSFGFVASRPALALAQAFRLMMRELEQAEEDLADFDGNDAGRMVIGALPMSRSVLLPRALNEFRAIRAKHRILIHDGPYDELLRGLRRGEIDVMVGALRDPAPIGDVVQERLFADGLSILAGPHHPLVGQGILTRDALADYAWVVPRAGSPSREQFDTFFAGSGEPERVIETGSILLMREILISSDHLGCISRAQARAELDKGLLAEVPVDAGWLPRPIGLTQRTNWEPTKAQTLMLDLLRAAASKLAGPGGQTV